MTLPDFGLIWYISAVEVFSLAIALILVVLAFRGYRKSGSRSLLLAAIGFGVLGVASLVEGVLYQFAGFTLDEAHAFRSTLTGVGLVVLVYSIYTTRAPESVIESARGEDAEPAGSVAVGLAAETNTLNIQRLVQSVVDRLVKHVAD
jgi:peptidoglycan/LPS O-acetylase OafA/YrhL